MKCSDIIQLIQKIAPENYAENWDNTGLNIGDTKKEINTIMIALDPSKDVVNQAVDIKADMLLTHHPLLFSPVKRITTDNFMGDKIIKLISAGIICYCGHTNMDIAVMADISAQMIGLEDTKPLEDIQVQGSEKPEGFGRYGLLENEITLKELGLKVKDAFGINSVRISDDLDRTVKKVAISPGAGKSMIKHALNSGAEVLITGDIDHHAALDAKEQGLSIIDAGHFGTEHFVVNYFKEYLEEEFSKMNLQKLPKIYIANEKEPYVII